MKIAIGADHGGYKLKEKLKRYLKSRGHAVVDYGTDSEESCNYPKYSFDVAKSIASGKAKRGIIICKSGIGSAIAANKVKRVRAAVCSTPLQARLSREHNDANVCVFGSRFTNFEKSKKILSVWLKTQFAGGRHARRVGLIEKYERKR